MKCRLAVAVTLIVVGTGCMTRGPDYDPIEPVNRGIFWFNDQVLDRWLLKPAAQGWTAISSEGVREAGQNFFNNVKFPIWFFGNLLNGRISDSGQVLVRFGINTTVGILGFRDQAAKWGIEPVRRDIGTAFGAWGIGPGPYLVIPILGPSNPRDLLGDVGGWLVTPWYSYYWPVPVIDAINLRALRMQLIADMRAESIDFYVAVRNAYYQNRQAKVRGEDASPEDEQDDLYDLPDDDYDDDYEGAAE